MEGYAPRGLGSLLEKRMKLLLHYEVVAYEISKLNRDIAELFVNSMSEKKVYFIRGNKVEYMNENGDQMIGMPEDQVYEIEGISSADTRNDIIYMLRGVDQRDLMAVRQENFHSFRFFEYD